MIFVYLAKFDEKSENAFIDNSTFQSLLITKGESTTSPKFADICLIKSKSYKAKFNSGYYISEWQMPDTNDPKDSGPNKLINYANTNVGTC
jgi:hypothetical protein